MYEVLWSKIKSVCLGAALAAFLRLGPLRETCVQPAPKSRLAVSGLFAQEDQRRFKADQKLPG